MVHSVRTQGQREPWLSTPSVLFGGAGPSRYDCARPSRLVVGALGVLRRNRRRLIDPTLCQPGACCELNSTRRNPLLSKHTLHFNYDYEYLSLGVPHTRSVRATNWKCLPHTVCSPSAVIEGFWSGWGSLVSCRRVVDWLLQQVTSFGVSHEAGSDSGVGG